MITGINEKNRKDVRNRLTQLGFATFHIMWGNVAVFNIPWQEWWFIEKAPINNIDYDLSVIQTAKEFMDGSISKNRIQT